MKEMFFYANRKIAENFSTYFKFHFYHFFPYEFLKAKSLTMDYCPITMDKLEKFNVENIFIQNLKSAYRRSLKISLI